MLVFNPSAPGRSVPLQTRRVLTSLTGKVVGFIDNSKQNFKYLADDIAERLVSQYGVASTVISSKRGPSIAATDSVIADMARQCDLVITGSGD
jgi:hypothetical protein